MRDPKSSTTAAFCEIKKSCKDCDLCDIIFQAFKKTNVQDKEITREFQIIFRTSYSKIEGEEPLMKPTNDNHECAEEWNSLGNFDDTIQDGALVTTTLGIPYIWINALCILQDHNKFTEVASRMNEIYRGLIVALVIASSDSVKNGFLKEHDLNYIPVTYSTDLAEDHRIYYEKQIFERDYGDIAFGSGFLWWLLIFLKFKRFKAHLPLSLSYPLISHTDTFRLWYDLVEEYTHSKPYTRGWAVERGPNLGAFCRMLKAQATSLCALSEIEDTQIDLVHPRDPFSAMKSGSVTIAGPLKKTDYQGFTTEE
ncbi:hypothetical protein DL95DRAFT_511762 [Leptodontidium sp. 2 PMI_412]|nr:hypothetical protein DL95DRAFT_511762 [Leptodontidium sp. 2 PMI_412]